jgi:adenine/guanine phosphoribosyltransferase-like PRPP-binding protein
MVIRGERSRKLRLVSLELIRNILYAAIFPTIVIGLLLIKIPKDALVSPYSVGKLPIIAGIVAMGAIFGVPAALAFVAVTTIRE